MKILIVDDEADAIELITQQFEDKIAEGVYQFYFAQNGEEALNLLREHADIEIVLTDIRMPVMDGITLLNHISKMNPMIKTIMVSAYSDMENIRKAMNMGAFDFITKPIDFEDLKNTLKKTIEALEALKESLREHIYLVDIQKELEIAKKIQEEIVPHNFELINESNKIQIYGQMIPARIVGGDFFDFFSLSATKIGFTIGDVSGKGVPAALFMAIAKTALRCFASQSLTLIECMEQTNRFLCYENESSMFVTLFYGVFDLEAGQLTYSNAGHNPPFIVTGGGTLFDIGRRDGIPLGVTTQGEFIEATLQFSKDDCILCYTDGVTEAMNINKEQYSEERLKEVYIKNASKPLPEMFYAITDEIKAFTKTNEQSDDITLLAVRYLG